MTPSSPPTHAYGLERRWATLYSMLTVPTDCAVRCVTSVARPRWPGIGCRRTRGEFCGGCSLTTSPVGRASSRRRAAPGSAACWVQLDLGIQRLAAFSGMGTENMTRSFGWRFLDMGRRIERSVQTSALLESLLDAGDPEDDGSLILLLEIADSFMTYRSRYLLTPQLAPVLDLLLQDETNPRSVAFQLAALAEHLAALPRDPAQPRARQRAADRRRPALGTSQGRHHQPVPPQPPRRSPRPQVADRSCRDGPGRADHQHHAHAISAMRMSCRSVIAASGAPR